MYFSALRVENGHILEMLDSGSKLIVQAFENLVRHQGHMAASKATWQDVSNALSALETRQASLRSKLLELHQKQEAKTRETNQNGQNDQEIMKLKLNYAARMVQLQRQGEILRSQSTRACRQAVRSRSIAVKAKEAAEEAKVESQQMRFTLQGLGDALDLKTKEAEDARRECEILREKLQLQERRSIKNDEDLQKQEILLEEAAAALNCFMSNYPKAPALSPHWCPAAKGCMSFLSEYRLMNCWSCENGGSWDGLILIDRLQDSHSSLPASSHLKHIFL